MTSAGTLHQSIEKKKNELQAFSDACYQCNPGLTFDLDIYSDVHFDEYINTRFNQHEKNYFYCSPYLNHASLNNVYENIKAYEKEAQKYKCNATIILELLKEIKNANFEAGKSYWHTRCWTLLYWQPVYLSLISVYSFNRYLDIATLVLHKKEQSVWGFHFTKPHDLLEQNTALIKHSALQLKRYLNCLFNSLQGYSPLSRKKAFRLTAATLLDALQRILQKQREGNKPLGLIALQNHADLWLKPLGLENEANYYLDDNNTVQLNQRACCMHYKIDSKNLCLTCPKTHCSKKL